MDLGTPVAETVVPTINTRAKSVNYHEHATDLPWRPTNELLTGDMVSRRKYVVVAADSREWLTRRIIYFR